MDSRARLASLHGEGGRCMDACQTSGPTRLPAVPLQSPGLDSSWPPQGRAHRLEVGRLTSASWMKYSCTSWQEFSMRYGGTLEGLFRVTWMEPAERQRAWTYM